MAHVQINGSRIFVDGVELTGSVLAEGFSIVDDGGLFKVTMTIRATLDANLPDASVDVVRSQVTQLEEQTRTLHDLHASVEALRVQLARTERKAAERAERRAERAAAEINRIVGMSDRRKDDKR